MSEIKLETGGKAEKPIARYRLCNNVHVDRCERGAPQVYWNVLKNQTVVVLEEDHERLLQAERERVKELAAIAKHDAEWAQESLDKLEALRQAIREKAREADSKGRWFCEKCGYLGKIGAKEFHGPQHFGCDYHAVWSSYVRAAELIALENNHAG